MSQIAYQLHVCLHPWPRCHGGHWLGSRAGFSIWRQHGDVCAALPTLRAVTQL